MPDKNVQVVRAMVDAVNRRDWDACIKDAAPGFVWDNSRAIGTDNRVVLTSAEDARDFFKKLNEIWMSLRVEVDETIAIGDHLVVPHTTQVRGRDGIEARARTTWLFTIRNGKVERVCLYQDKDEAVEAAQRSDNAESEESAEIARRTYAAWNAGEIQWVLDHMTEDCEIRPLSRYLDLEPAYRGKDGFARFAQAWSDAWEQIHLSVMRVEGLRDGRVLTLLTHEGRGRTSGVYVTEEVGHMVEFRDGKIADVQVIEGWDATLEAAGLPATRSDRGPRSPRPLRGSGRTH